MAAVFHTYVLYPLLLSWWSKGKQLVFNTLEDTYTPFVSIIVSAFNEESVIAEKIESIYAGSYPLDSFELLIGSDNSSDKTNAIVSAYAKRYPNLHFVPYTQRRGKQNVVNDLVELSQGSILVLTDANVIFHPHTLRQIAAPFVAHSEIGLVDTKMVNRGQKADGISEQETAYISREVMIKHQEAILWGSMMGPFGGCYAIRKSCYRPVPPNALVDDFYINMKTLQAGYQCVNNLEAIVYEDVSNNLGIEMRRKTRIATGNFQNLRWFGSMLWPLWRGSAFAFLSHKVLRWLTPFFILLALLSAACLWPLPLYKLALAAQLIALCLPLTDFALKKVGIHCKLLRFATHFYGMNLSLLIGFFRSIKGVKSGVWAVTQRNQ